MILIEAGADLNAETAQGHAPLPMIKETEDQKIIELLKNHGAS